jgi:hypothetical protein
MRTRVARRTNGTLAHLHASDRTHQGYKGPLTCACTMVIPSRRSRMRFTSWPFPRIGSRMHLTFFPFGPVAIKRRQQLRRQNTEHPCGGVTHSHGLSPHRDPQSRFLSHRDSQSRFSSHCAAQSHLSSRPFRAPLLPARKPNVATGSLALAAAPVTAAIRLFAFHRHTVSAFGPPLAMAPPDAQRPRQVQTKPSIHVRVSAPTGTDERRTLCISD